MIAPTGLVTAARELSKNLAEEMLEAFGEHWVLRTAMAGLRSRHARWRQQIEGFPSRSAKSPRVVMIYPILQPPSSRVSDVTVGSLLLPHRDGLAHFVRGFGKRFENLATISQPESRADGADHGAFTVEWGNR